jgi:hypothetical protein
MSITVGDIRLGVLHEMREYSNSGTVQSTTDIKDYLLSIIPLLNVYQRELATTTNKMKRKHEISHNQPINQLGFIYWEENKYHTGGTDISYSAQGSKAYSFQVDGRATIYIEEQIAGVWTTLETITHVPTTGEGYRTYKKKITASDTANMIRVRFSGSYRYPYRWVALFSDNFYDDSEVPTFSPYVPYDLPSDYFRLERVEFSHADRQLGAYSAYKTDELTAAKKILFNWYEIGEFAIYYYAYPAVLATPDPNNILASDSATLDIADECAPVLIHRIAATLLRDENPYISDTLNNEYQVSKAELVQNSNYDQGEQGIIINSNW